MEVRYLLEIVLDTFRAFVSAVFDDRLPALVAMQGNDVVHSVSVVSRQDRSLEGDAGQHDIENRADHSAHQEDEQPSGGVNVQPGEISHTMDSLNGGNGEG